MGIGICLHADQEEPEKRTTKMEESLSAEERSAWNNFVEAREAKRKARDAENSACDAYMRAMDVSLEAMKSEQAAFDVWLRTRGSLPQLPTRKWSDK
jgi:hypothetical protein